jgi:WD40 repeat protein
MAVDTAAQFVEVLRATQLLTADQASALGALVVQFPTAAALARELVKRTWLTPYQANQLARGRGQELVLGPYHLLEPLAEGGMGTVFKARHPLMKRVVALKIIRGQRSTNPDLVRRFEREIVAAGRLLSHPNVVIAHDAVRVGDSLLLVMEYVEGTDLSKLLRVRGPLAVGEACEYVRQAALGLQHAHESGLVHRDVKPSNLLLSARGGVVKVLDMGLALLGATSPDESITALTETGTVMGTPDYMAPEQADNAHAVDIRADIYSLGCTLYALLTGRAPFAGGTLAQKIAGHLHAEPPPLESLRPDLPPALVALIRRMMAKRPADRLATPGEVAAVLLPFCQPSVEASSGQIGLPLPASAADAETIAANPATQAAAPTIPTTAVTALVPAPKPRGVKVPKVWLLAGAGAGGLLLVLVLVLALGGTGGSTPDGPGSGPKGKEVGKAPVLELDPDAPTIEVRKFVGHTRQINVVALSRDGALALSGSADKTVRLWDAKTGQHLHTFEVGKGVWGADLSPDGKYALAGEGGWFGEKGYETAPPHDIHLWDVEKRKEVRRFKGHQGEIQAVAFLPDGRRFLSSSAAEGTWLWEMDGDKEPRKLPELSAFLTIPLSADGRRMVLVDQRTQLRVWTIPNWEGIRLLKGPQRAIRCAAISADGRRALASSHDQMVHVWNVDSGNPLRAPAMHPSIVTGVALTADGRWGATGGGTGLNPKTGGGISLRTDTVIRLFNMDTGKEVRTLEGHTGAIMGLTFSADGRYLLSGACDTTMRLWRWAK